MPPMTNFWFRGTVAMDSSPPYAASRPFLTSYSSGSHRNNSGHLDHVDGNAPQYPAGNRKCSGGRSCGSVELIASFSGVRLARPSATGDIEGVIIHGTQGRGA